MSEGQDAADEGSEASETAAGEGGSEGFVGVPFPPSTDTAAPAPLRCIVCDGDVFSLNEWARATPQSPIYGMHDGCVGRIGNDLRLNWNADGSPVLVRVDSTTEKFWLLIHATSEANDKLTEALRKAGL